MRIELRKSAVPVAVILSGVVAASLNDPGPPARPHVKVDGYALGRAYAPTLAPSLADGWLAAADAIEAGKTVAEAQEALQAAFKAARVRAFAATVVPEFSKVLPEGAEPGEPGDPAARAEVAKLWRDFARGLKEDH